MLLEAAEHNHNSVACPEHRMLGHIHLPELKTDSRM